MVNAQRIDGAEGEGRRWTMSILVQVMCILVQCTSKVPACDQGFLGGPLNESNNIPAFLPTGGDLTNIQVVMRAMP